MLITSKLSYLLQGRKNWQPIFACQSRLETTCFWNMYRLNLYSFPNLNSLRTLLWPYCCSQRLMLPFRPHSSCHQYISNTPFFIIPRPLHSPIFTESERLVHTAEISTSTIITPCIFQKNHYT